jgi:hypothetical protein
MSDPIFDVEDAARWFAIRYNNATWDWLEAVDDRSNLTPTDPIIHIAHAAFQHWTESGTTINRARAACLLANVHATLGNASLASGLAGECLQLVDDAGSLATDWDLAFAHDSWARALASADAPQTTMARSHARTLGDAIADSANRDVFDAWFEIWPFTRG